MLPFPENGIFDHIMIKSALHSEEQILKANFTLF